MLKRRKNARKTDPFPPAGSRVYSESDFTGPQRSHTVHLDKVTGDRRRVNRTTFESTIILEEGIQPESMEGAQNTDNIDVDWIHGDTGLPEDFTDRATQVNSNSTKDEPLWAWVPRIGAYLSKMMRLCGRREYDTGECTKCKREGRYRCRECLGGDLYCKGCIVFTHATLPLHRIEFWNDTCFFPTSLRALGLRVQLGHKQGETCASGGASAHKNFMVIHTNGFHDVSVDFCSCQPRASVGEYWQQLMRREWFPATFEKPQSCCTFAALRLFHHLTLQGKLSIYDFYNSLERYTDNAGIHTPKYRYQAFSRIVRMWRLLKLGMKGGIANTPERPFSDVKPGELSVRCWACPRSGVNLPSGWKNTPIRDQFKYFLFPGVDACFRLKRRNVSSNDKDPGLSTGLSYFVPDKPFREYVSTVTDQEEISTCTGFSAMEQANTKHHSGYAATGCVLCLCARHECIQPNRVSDLQVGERYANTDYMLASVLKHHDDQLTKVLSYDICCQYHINLPTRLSKLPASLAVGFEHSLWKFAIPKLHIAGHRYYCQITFSFTFMLGGGNTDGEGVERHWASLGPIGSSTREMGPGNRHDTIDDHLGNWNSKKNLGLGDILDRKLRHAKEEAEIHQLQYVTFSEKNEAQVKEWKGEVVAWESAWNHQRKELRNPFETVKTGISQEEVRLELAKEEAESSLVLLVVGNVTSSTFVLHGLHLEEQQRRNLRLEILLRPAVTPTQKAIIVDRRSRLQRGIARFRGLQATFTPSAIALLDSVLHPTDNASERPVESISLFLPSELNVLNDRAGNLIGLRAIESRYRDAQVKEAIGRVRDLLFVKSRLLIDKSLHARHQAANTRFQSLLQRNQQQIDQHAEKYRGGRDALMRLCNGNEDAVGWRRLEKRDLTRLEDRDTTGRRKQGTKRSHEGTEIPDDNEAITMGESSHVLSWIWTGIDCSMDSEAMKEATRVEWCKTYSRMNRWKEEVALLDEEMCRTLVSIEYDAVAWEKAAKTSDRGTAEGEGRIAYAQGKAFVPVHIVGDLKIL